MLAGESGHTYALPGDEYQLIVGKPWLGLTTAMHSCARSVPGY